MKKFLLLTAAALSLGIGTQAIAHCGACGEDDNHAEKMVDDKHAADKHMKMDIVDTAASNEDFSTLIAAVKAADLVEALKGDGPLTVFAPTNEAFAKLPEGTLENLLKPENKEQLQSILTYHVIPAKIKSSAIAPGETSVETLQGQQVKVVASDNGVTVDGANVIKTDLYTSNGVIHVIDSVILPKE